VHVHLVVRDGVFDESDAGLAFTLLPAPTGGELLAILDRVTHRGARRPTHARPGFNLGDLATGGRISSSTASRRRRATPPAARRTAATGPTTW
jgi:hypothetical protein